MKIQLLITGKTTDARLVSLIDDYRERLKHYVPFEMVVLPDLKNAKALSEEQVKTAEGEAMLRFFTPSMDVILLDEHGKEFRSVEFAEWLQKKMTS
ncbi:MAG: 23S rRNA (pseudouridine(1915)-N(3))-methyltransferase RlmH, partial [Paludibacteraceae bacterium]|nr:23S rRNA (pseudouridine(1915)-N(3))-methyltransferase RlmH [Paludibacteraceae bacterium]